MNRGVAYLRRSLDEQDKQIYSIDVQRRGIAEAAVRHGVRIAKYMPAESRSGGDRNRPIFLEMINAVQSGVYDGIAAYTVDRLTRNLTDADRILDLIIEHDVELFIATMPGMDWSTAEGAIVFVQFATWGVIERLLTKKRTIATHKYLRREGRHLGRTPYGYKKIYLDKKRKEYIIEIVPEEAERIQNLFHLAIETGWGRQRLARAVGLTEDQVRTILNNPRYTGYDVVDGEIVRLELPPIISVQTFVKLHPDSPLRALL